MEISKKPSLDVDGVTFARVSCFDHDYDSRKRLTWGRKIETILIEQKISRFPETVSDPKKNTVIHEEIMHTAESRSDCRDQQPFQNRCNNTKTSHFKHLFHLFVVRRMVSRTRPWLIASAFSTLSFCLCGEKQNLLNGIMMMQSSPTMIKTVTFLSCVEALLLGDMEKIYVRETRERKRESQEGGKKGCALLYCAPRLRLR